MWCLNKKAIMTDEDPVVRQKRNTSKAKKFLKRMGNKVKKWVKKPKEALPNPNNANNNNNNPEPLYGRRPEIALDLTHPFPIYNVMNNIHSGSSSNIIQPSDPKKTIMFTTSSSKFMRIEEVSHVPHEGKMILGGCDLALRALEMEKVKEIAPNKGKGKGIEYPADSSLSIQEIQDGKLLIERGKGIVAYESEERADMKMESFNYSNDITIEEFPIKGFSREANEAVHEIKNGAQIEEIPMEGISLEANQSIGASMSQLVRFRPFCLSYYVLKYHLSLMMTCLPPYSLDHLAGWSELSRILQSTWPEEFHLTKFEAALEGLIRDTFDDFAPQMTYKSLQNFQLLVSAFMDDSIAVQSFVQIEEIPPVSQEANETGAEIPPVSQEANETGAEIPSEPDSKIEANPPLLF